MTRLGTATIHEMSDRAVFRLPWSPVGKSSRRMSGTVELYRVFKRDGSGQHRAGFIDAKGALRIAPVFDGALRFSEGLAAVQDVTTRKMGAIDAHGEWVIPPRFDKLRWFSEGLCPYQAGPLLGFIDRNGRTKIKAAFHEARGFQEGVAAVRRGYDGARYIRKNGAVVAESAGVPCVGGPDSAARPEDRSFRLYRFEGQDANPAAIRFRARVQGGRRRGDATRSRRRQPRGLH